MAAVVRVGSLTSSSREEYYVGKNARQLAIEPERAHRGLIGYPSVDRARPVNLRVVCLGQNASCFTTFCRGEYCKHLVREGLQVGKSTRASAQYDDGYVELRKILLELKIPVGCQQDVELTLGPLEKHSIGHTRPAPFWDSGYVVAYDLTCEPCVNALVEQDTH